jgi:hypothetical protein
MLALRSKQKWAWNHRAECRGEVVIGAEGWWEYARGRGLVDVSHIVHAVTKANKGESPPISAMSGKNQIMISGPKIDVHLRAFCGKALHDGGPDRPAPAKSSPWKQVVLERPSGLCARTSAERSGEALLATTRQKSARASRYAVCSQSGPRGGDTFSAGVPPWRSRLRLGHRTLRTQRAWTSRSQASKKSPAFTQETPVLPSALPLRKRPD